MMPLNQNSKIRKGIRRNKTETKDKYECEVKNAQNKGKNNYPLFHALHRPAEHLI